MIKKFNELFRAGKRTREFIDLLNPLIDRAVGDIYIKKDCIAIYDDKTAEICQSIADGIDFLLENVRNNKKKKYQIVDLNKCLKVNVSKYTKMELAIADNRYISGVKKHLCEIPAFIAGELSWGLKGSRRDVAVSHPAIKKYENREI